MPEQKLPENFGGFESFEEFEKRLEEVKKQREELDEYLKDKIKYFIEKTTLLELLKMDEGRIEVTEEPDVFAVVAPGVPKPTIRKYHVPYESFFPDYDFQRLPVDPKHVEELEKKFDLFRKDESENFTIMDNEFKVLISNPYQLEKHKFTLEIWQYVGDI